MDENDDLASQYGVVTDAEGTAHPATEMAPPPPPAPEPFTQADSLRLQKLQVGMTQAQEQMDDGTLSPDEGHQLLQNIQALATPLALKQKRATEQAKQEQAGDLMQQSAQMQAIDQANKVHSAQGFQDRVSTYTDAMTGKTVHMVEAANGKWQELDFSKAADAADQDPYAAAGVSGEVGQLEPPSTPGPAGMESQLPPAAGGPVPPPAGPRTEIGDAYAAQGGAGQQGAAPGTPQVQPAPDGGHTMTIQNGSRVEKWHFAPDGTTTKVADSQPPQQAQGQLSAVQLNPAEMAILKHNAQQVVGGPRLTGNPLADRQAIAENQAAVNSLSSHFIQAEMKRRQNEVNAKAISARQETGIEAKKQAQEERLAAQKERTQQEESADRLIDMAGKQLETERGRWTDTSTGQLRDGAPKYLTDPALYDKEVASRVQRHRNLRQGILGGPAPAAGGAGGPPAVDKAKADLEQTLGKNVSGSVPVNAPSGMPEGRDPAPDELTKAGGITPERASALHDSYREGMKQYGGGLRAVFGGAGETGGWFGPSHSEAAGDILEAAHKTGRGLTPTGVSQLREHFAGLRTPEFRAKMLKLLEGK